jgi:PAS domain S-box-containing protein
LITQRVTALQALIDRRRDSGFEAARALVASGEGAGIMEEIREAVDRMVTEERARWAASATSEDRELDSTTLLAVAGSILCVLVLGVVALLVLRENEHRTRAADHLAGVVAALRAFRTALDQHATVVITDSAGRITEANDRFCTMSQFSREELIGQDTRVVNSGHHSKEFMRDLWQTLESGQTWHGEIKNRAKDGSTHWVATTIVPFLDKRGVPVEYFSIRADITNRKESEEALRNNEAWLRLAMESAAMGAW